MWHRAREREGWEGVRESCSFASKVRAMKIFLNGTVVRRWFRDKRRASNFKFHAFIYPNCVNNPLAHELGELAHSNPVIDYKGRGTRNRKLEYHNLCHVTRN